MYAKTQTNRQTNMIYHLPKEPNKRNQPTQIRFANSNVYNKRLLSTNKYTRYKM